MKLSKFRELTADLPETADLWMLTKDGAWAVVAQLEVHKEERRYVQGYDPKNDPHQFADITEIRLQTIY